MIVFPDIERYHDKKLIETSPYKKWFGIVEEYENNQKKLRALNIIIICVNFEKKLIFFPLGVFIYFNFHIKI